MINLEDYSQNLNLAISNNVEFEKCNEAMNCLKTLIEKSETWQEPIFLQYLPVLMDNISFFKTAEQAKVTATTIINKMNIFSINVVLDLLFECFSSLKWQTKCGALTILGLFKNLDKKVVQQNLPNVA